MSAAVAAPEIKVGTLRMLAWARLWSPLSDEATLRATWGALGLPGDFDDVRIDYWNAFHAGIPQPPVPVLVHALVQRDAGTVREDLLRVAEYLEVEGGEHRLPPDHLGSVCELFALGLEREDPVLIAGLRERHLRPWIQAAGGALAGRPALSALLACFADDVDSAADHC